MSEALEPAIEKVESTADMLSAVGGLAMPEEAKQTYIYIVKPSSLGNNNGEQLVISALADQFDSYPVLVD